MKKVVAILLMMAMLLNVVSVFAQSATEQLQDLYANAELSMALGNYSEAAGQFEKLGAYSDASQMAMYCKALSAAETLGMYDVAVSAFTGLGDFKDSSQLAIYYSARSKQESGDSFELTESDSHLNAAIMSYNDAIEIYTELALFKDSLTRLSACQERVETIRAELQARSDEASEKIYQEALSLESQEEYQKAIDLFTSIPTYKDSKAHISACKDAIKADKYQMAISLKEQKKYDEAIIAFKEISDYQDSIQQVLECKYLIAQSLEAEGKLMDAIAKYQDLVPYEDCTARIESCKESLYEQAIASEESKAYGDAYELYVYLGDYKDVSSRRTSLFICTGRTGNGSPISYTYDADNVLISSSVNDEKWPSETEYHYENGKLVSSTQTGVGGRTQAGEVSRTFIETVFYDEYGNEISMKNVATDLVYEKGKETTTEEVYEYEYDDAGRILSKTIYYNGEIFRVLTYEYILDDQGRVITEFETKPDDEKYKYKTQYIYNDDGLLAEEKLDWAGDPSVKQHSSWTITYEYGFRN